MPANDTRAPRFASATALFAVVPPAAWRDGQDAFGVDAVVSGGDAGAAGSRGGGTLPRGNSKRAGPARITTRRAGLRHGAVLDDVRDLLQGTAVRPGGSIVPHAASSIP